MSATRTYQYVNYLWDDAKAASMAGDEVALLLYRSNILGAEPQDHQLWWWKYLPAGPLRKIP